LNHLSYDWLFNLLVVGNGAVGKTSIVNRFVTGDYKTTIGKQFMVKLVPVSNDKSAYLQIWDMTGQARFTVARKNYYLGAAGIIIVYDITRESSFRELQNWILEAFEATSHALPIALVGNKADLTEKCVVNSERGTTFVDAISDDSDVPTIFLETSAVTGQNIDRLFTEFAEAIIDYQPKPDFDEYFQETPNSRVVANGWHQTKMNLACHDKKYVLRCLGFHELYGLLVTTEEILSVLPEVGSFREGTDILRELLITRLEQQVKAKGWHQTKMNLAYHDKKYVLRYLGFPELCGLLVTTEELLSVLTERGDFSEGIDALRAFLMTMLEQQVKGGGPTFDLDIDRLIETGAARFVDDIIALRFEEIRSLSAQVNSEFDIDPWALWKTYYGRMLIKSTKSPRELNLRETRNMLLELEAAGIPVGFDS